MNEIEKAIQLLEENGYKITRPPKLVKDEYTFANAWNLYQKKVGCKDKLEKKWNSMSLKDRKAATEFIPSYVLSTPDKQFRKNFQTFLNQRGWEDEILGATPPPAVPPTTTEEEKPIGERWKNAQHQETTASQDSERKRMLGLIELVKQNPQSSARLSLLGYYKRGYLQELGISWQP